MFALLALFALVFRLVGWWFDDDGDLATGAGTPAVAQLQGERGLGALAGDATDGAILAEYETVGQAAARDTPAQRGGAAGCAQGAADAGRRAQRDLLVLDHRRRIDLQWKVELPLSTIGSGECHRQVELAGVCGAAGDPAAAVAAQTGGGRCRPGVGAGGAAHVQEVFVGTTDGGVVEPGGRWREIVAADGERQFPFAAMVGVGNGDP